MMQYIQLLSDYIQQRWHPGNADHNNFADLAMEALQQYPPQQYITTGEILDHVLTCARLPRQTRMDKDFGQPSLTLFRNSHYHIDALFWLESTTAVHHHSFSGAFAVLEGSSLECTYSFSNATAILDSMKIGTIDLQRVAYLETGSIRKINAGPSYIHSLFHLEHPSCTLIVRTPDFPSVEKEFEYMIPYLAVDPRYKTKKLKRLQCLELLMKTNEARYREKALALLSRCDMHEAFLILRQARLAGNYVNGDLFLTLADYTRNLHKRMADLVLACVEEDRRRMVVISKRKTVRQKDLRFFLALLLNLPDKQSILSVISEKYSGTDPAVLVQQWVHELLETKILDFTDNEAAAGIIDLLCKGTEVSSILEVYSAKKSITQTSDRHNTIESLVLAVVCSPILSPLFK